MRYFGWGVVGWDHRPVAVAGNEGPALVGQVRDVDTFGDGELEDRVAEQGAGDPDRDRTEPGDLAGLFTVDRTPNERVECVGVV